MLFLTFCATKDCTKTKAEDLFLFLLSIEGTRNDSIYCSMFGYVWGRVEVCFVFERLPIFNVTFQNRNFKDVENTLRWKLVVETKSLKEHLSHRLRFQQNAELLKKDLYDLLEQLHQVNYSFEKF
jgi:hypothetical protein